MALDTFLPQFFSQEFAQPEMFEFPYLMMATDRSAMVPAGGNQVTWPDVEGSVETQEYTRGTPLNDGEGQDTQYVLQINQFRAVQIPLDDTDRIQRMPQVMGQYTVQASRELMWEMNAYCRNVFQAGGAGARRRFDSMTEPMRGDHQGLTGNVARVTYDISDNEWTSEKGRQKLITAMDEDAGGFAKRHGWVSQDADTKGIAIVPIEVGNAFRAYLRDDKPNLGAGSIVDSAFGLGRIMKVAGWEIMEDVTLPELNLAVAGSNAAPNGRINFMHPQRRGLYYGKQLQTMESERIQRQFGTRLKALYLYGAVQGPARHIYGIDLVFSA